MNHLKVGALFAGVGGLEMGVSQVLDAEPAWLAEFEAAPSRILAQRFPGVPNLGDVTKVDWAAVEPVDIITGGSPCQDLSHAGKRAGMTDGTRSNLWVAMREAIATIRPRLVVWENVRGALSACASSDSDSDLGPCPRCLDQDPGSKFAHAPNLRALGRVLGDLASIGYDAAWHVIRASDVGAPHQRERVFVLAWPADDTSVIQPASSAGGLGGGSPVLTLLPSPRTSDTNGAGVHGDGGLDLRTAVTLLPTPAVNDMGAGKELEDWDAWTARMKAAHGNGNGHGRSLDVEARRLHVEGAAQLLPTPTTRDHKGANQRGDDTCLTGALLPTPRATRGGSSKESAALLPTPRASDGTKGGPNQRGSAGDLMLPSAVTLLPTPKAINNENRQSADRYGPNLGMAISTTPGWDQRPEFGLYAPAIARWEAALGRPAPTPTEPTGKGGAHRLSPRFVEWLMGLPDGWVTGESVEAWRVRLVDRRLGHDARPVGHRGPVARRVAPATRNEQLKALGNGVVPQQAAAALRHLLGVREWALTNQIREAA